MNIETTPEHNIKLTKVWKPVTLETEEGNILSIRMRDDTFEFIVKSNDIESHYRVNFPSTNVTKTKTVSTTVKDFVRLNFVSKEKENDKEYDNWPLGNNPDMDDHARSCCLHHWSCVNPNDNDTWMRTDGKICRPFEYLKSEGSDARRVYMSGLRLFDKNFPLQ